MEPCVLFIPTSPPIPTSPCLFSFFHCSKARGCGDRRGYGDRNMPSFYPHLSCIVTDVIA